VPATRPPSVKFWKTYLNYDAVPASSTVWDTIGGSIGETYGPPDENSCAARVSYGLDYGGAHIEKFSAASVNLKDHSYKGKAGDGLRYIVSAMQMAAYLRRVWGAPDHTVKTVKALEQVIASFSDGQCAVFATPNPVQGHGHAGVLRAGYSDPYVKTELPVDVWILPS
jgi:hypothetical protein